MCDIKPNLFIVGAGKSGTFALYQYLGSHPSVFMAPKKELNFFGKDLRLNKPRLTESEYLDFFCNCRSDIYRGEASVSYLLSKTAAFEIKTFNQKSKIIIMVRDPVEVMYSRYFQNVKTGIETIKTFEGALEAEKDRRKGINMPKRDIINDWLYYREWIKYSEQVERYLSVFGQKNVFVGLYDDFNDNPKGFYTKLLDFLGLGAEKLPVFERVNSNKNVRSILVAQHLRGSFPFSHLISKYLLPNKKARNALRNLIQRLNTFETQREPLPKILENRLRQETEKEISYIENLLDRNLSHWKSPDKHYFSSSRSDK